MYVYLTFEFLFIPFDSRFFEQGVFALSQLVVIFDVLLYRNQSNTKQYIHEIN